MEPPSTSPDPVPPVGFFTARDEEVERMSLTPKERAALEADMLGTTAAFEQMNLRGDDVMQSLVALDAELSKIPDDEKLKSAFMEAQKLAPHLISADHKTSFLIAEEFDVEKAAQRILNYWSYKRELFGPEKWLLPLTLDGALKDDEEALINGFIQLLPVKDERGRGIIFFYPRKECFEKFTSESLLRTLWYILCAACEDLDVQKRGIVGIIFAKEETLSFKLMESVSGVNRIIDRCFPVAVRCMHRCHPSFLEHMLRPILNFAVGKQMRVRHVFHYGSEEHVQQQLLQFGLPLDRLPILMGGSLVLDTEKWVSERKVIESKFIGKDDTLLSLFSDKTGQDLLSALVTDDESSDVHTQPKKKAVAAHITSTSSVKTPNKKSTVPKRRADERMDQAVDAVVGDPGMSLADALCQGGFFFPDYGKSGFIDKTCFDAEGVSLSQRKNQLLRRVRKRREINRKSKASRKSRKSGSESEEVKGLPHAVEKKKERSDSFDEAILQLPGLDGLPTRPTT